MISGSVSSGAGLSGAPALVPSVHLAAASAVAAAAGLTGSARAPVLPVVALGPDETETSPSTKTEPVAAIAISKATDGVRVGPDQIKVSYDVAFKGIAEKTAQVTVELERMYDLTRAQRKGWYRASVTAAGVGMCLVAAAVIVLILGQLTTGVVTTIASLVPNALASMFFVNSRAADARVDALTKRLTEYREAAALVDIAQTVSDRRLQDDLKAQIVRKMLANQ
jgi:hypothetical protein